MLPSTSSVDTNVTISGLHYKLENVKEEADIETKDDAVDDTAKHSDVDNDQVDNIVDEIKVEIKDEEDSFDDNPYSEDDTTTDWEAGDQHGLNIQEYLEASMVEEQEGEAPSGGGGSDMEGGRFSDKIADYSTCECMICNKVFKYKSFLPHLQSAHEVSFPHYRRTYGDVKIIDKVKHRCKICGAVFVYFADNLKKHLRKHGMSVGKYQSEYLEHVDGRFSDEPGDYTTYKCKICQYVDKYREVRKHLDTVHSMSITQYKNDHGKLEVVDLVMHKCKICGKIIQYSSVDHLYHHLKTNHQISSQDYYHNFLGKKKHGFQFTFKEESHEAGGSVVVNEGRLSDKPGDYTTYKCGLCDYVGKYCATRKHVRCVHHLTPAEYKQQYGEFEFDDLVKHTCKLCLATMVTDTTLRDHLRNRHGLTMSKYEKDYLAAVTEGRISDKPGDYTTYKCAVCDQIGSYNVMKSHVNVFHKTTLTEFMRLHGKPEIVELVRHKCRICQRILEASRDNIFNHLKKRHNLHINQYENGILTSDEGNVGEASDSTSSDKFTLDDLELNTSDSNLETQCPTTTTDSGLEKSHSTESKLSEKTLDVFAKGEGTEKDIEGNLDKENLPVTLKRKWSEFEENLVNTIEAQGCGTEEPQADPFVYSCPLCNYQLDCQALNNGIGISHLRQYHLMTAIDFSRRGLRWRKLTSEQALFYQHHPEYLDLAKC